MEAPPKSNGERDILALPDVGALASSQLASTLDPALSRATISLTLGLGLGMVATSLLDQRTARPTTRPRGKAE
jgi:hypothetical protein